MAAIPVRKADPEQLAQALRYAMVKVGLRAANWPNAEEEELLFAHIITEYGNHTADEIRLAFDMAIAGKLDLDFQKQVVCYENFSCLYFSGVINAYRRWAAQAHRHAVVELPKVIPPPRWEVNLEYAGFLLKLLRKRLNPPLKP